MTANDRRRLDEKIEKAREKQARAIARQAKSFLDVAIRWTGDEYVDARLLEEFLATPVTDLIFPVIQAYAEYAKPNAAYTGDDGSPLIPLNQETLVDMTEYVDSYNPESPDEDRNTEGVLRVGELLAILWPAVRRQMDAEDTEKRDAANRKRQATRQARLKGGRKDGQ